MDVRPCILFQGPLYPHCIDMLCNTINNHPYSIISTWKTSDELLLERLRETGAHIILNDFPDNPGIQNVNAANISICSGIEAAATLGYTHVLRFRTDYKLNDFAAYITLCNSISTDKLVFMAWFIHNGGYLLDHVIYGPLELVRKYREPLQVSTDSRFTEKFLQESYFGKADLTFSDVSDKVCFSSKLAVARGIKLYRIKELANCENDDMAAYASNSP